MEDEKIKNIFNDYQPDLSSSFQFMTKLKKNMETVEILKQHNVALKKRNKVAVAVAAVSGFVVGVLMTLLFPLIGNWVSDCSISLPYFQINDLTIDYRIVACIVMAGVSLLTALNVYEIAWSKLAQKDPQIV